jgi:hypothetical protein
MDLEKKFQHRVISELMRRYPGAIVLKNDPNYIQGFPDLTILYNNWWGVLEVKADETSSRQPNQAYYVEECDRMSFGSFIFPQNHEEVLHAIQLSLRSNR